MAGDSTYELLWKRSGAEPRRTAVPENGLIIGRADECGIPLAQDQSVSRKHAQIYFENGRLSVKDLGSRNGIMVNSKTTPFAELHPGDVLRVGNQEFEIAASAEPYAQSVVSMAKSEMFQQSLLRDTVGTPLATLFHASMLLGEIFDLDELLRELLGLVFESLPVQRGFILTVESVGEPAQLRASLSRQPDESGPPISQTLVDKVVRSREAILVADAVQDSRFDTSASIADHEIHSAMCAPLLGRESVVGVIYVDSGRQVRPFQGKSLELLSAIGRIAGVAVENATLHHQIVQSERLAAIGEATAGLGHCIKNMLTGIRASSDLISQGVQSQRWEQLQVGWPILQRSIDRIETLVLNMLTYSRGGSGHREACDIAAICSDVVETVAQQAAKHAVEVRFRYEGSTRLDGDGRELHRVVLNLVANALDACETGGGTVEILAVGHPESVVVEVTDSGAGIGDEHLPHIFDAFFTTKGSRGTGLGLACCKKIVESHGGRISIENCPERGARATVELPRRRLEELGTQLHRP
ncbi:MAG: FHA domain-containing protein [Candidatus Hydrogenedens sp.]|nr:FHA domain-containing protein [Candidatus Hydrogenedens sp.]